MKILFTFYIPNGGVETLNRIRNQTLRQLGIECHFLYLQPGVGIQNIADPTFMYITSLDEDISQLIAAQQFDAIVVTSDVYLPQRLRKLHYKGPIIYEAQGLGTRDEAIHILMEGQELLQTHCCGALMPPTSHLVELISQICPQLPQFVFQNPMDINQFAPQLVAKQPFPIVAWVGRLEFNKNWREYLEIVYWLMVQTECEYWMFIDMSLAPEPSKQEFFARVSELELDHKVKIFPNVLHAEMPYYFSTIAESGGMLISTSIMEGFGYAVAEATCSSCPVLSTDSDGVRSFIIHDVTGKFYQQGNIPEAVKEAFELIYHHTLREHIRSQGRMHMITHFGPNQYASSFLEMLHAVNVY